MKASIFIPQVGAAWSDGHVLRRGCKDDATTVQSWTSTDMQVAGAIKAAAQRFIDGEAGSFVLTNVRGDLIGVFTLVAPHLQFAYLVERLRRKGLGIRAASVLVGHYFGSTTEQWLGDSGSVSSSGAALTRALGFRRTRLTRQQWQRLRPQLAALFAARLH